MKLMIDTSVWLDLAKDQRQPYLLTVLESLCSSGEVALVEPQIVLDEFQQNKTRIVEESARGHANLFKRVRDAVSQYSAESTKAGLLGQLDEIDHRIGTLGDAAHTSVMIIERLFGQAAKLAASDAIKVRAANRAIEGRAPFHRQKNEMADAIVIETYAEALRRSRTNFTLVTHNTRDFSDFGVDNRKPHPDIADYFTLPRSAYSINLAETLNAIAPEMMEDYKFETEWNQDTRRLSEILEAMDLLFDQIWYNRHWNTRVSIREGKTRIVAKESFPPKDPTNRPIQRDVWQRALKAAKRVEKKRGLENLGPWDDFEWGMLNGKLSALRWVLGDEWDMLDT
jgi:predicted nucleic acid-binding protein